jgi:hypothetical protein
VLGRRGLRRRARRGGAGSRPAGTEPVGDAAQQWQRLSVDLDRAAVEPDQEPGELARPGQDRDDDMAAYAEAFVFDRVRETRHVRAGASGGGAVQDAGDQAVRTRNLRPRIEAGQRPRDLQVGGRRRGNLHEPGRLHVVEGLCGPRGSVHGAPRLS